jgi:glycine cleavage system H protein
MTNIPENLLYTKTHEWVRKEEDGTITIGVTDHAQQMLGDLVFVETPHEEDVLLKEAECCVLESVKAAGDVYAPVSGEVTEINAELDSTPELVNQDPYEAGWLFRMTPGEASELDGLMTAEQYSESIKSEVH